jgi:hypothetical protein
MDGNGDSRLVGIKEDKAADGLRMGGIVHTVYSASVHDRIGQDRIRTGEQ